MPRPTAFSKIRTFLSDKVGYAGERLPQSATQIVMDLRPRVEEAEEFAHRRLSEYTTWRDYILGHGQKAKYLAELQKLEMSDFFVVTNYVRPLISHLVSLLTSSLGVPYVVPANEDDEERAKSAETITNYLQAMRHRDRYSLQLRQWLEDAAVCGTGWLRAYYDPMRKRAVIERQDAATVYPEPNAKTIREAEFVAIRHVYNLGYARRRWPDLDMKKYEKAGPPEQAEEGEGQQQIVPQAVVWEVYHDFGDRLSIWSDDQILYTGPAPVLGQGYPLFPFTFNPSNLDLHGYSLLRDLEDPQDFYNRITTRMDWYTRFWAMPMAETDDPNANIEIKPGAKWFTRQGFHANPVHPPDFPGELFGMLHNQQQALDTISGIQEVNRGEKPQGITAGVALDLLRQMSQQRQAGPLEDATSALQDAYGYLLALLQEYFEGYDTIVYDADGTTARASLGATDLYGRYDVEDEETGELVADILPHEYNVLMQPPGDLPRSPAAQAELAIQLFQLGAIDDVALLELVKLEGRKEVLARKAAQMQAMLEGQMAGMKERAMADQQSAGMSQEMPQ